MWKLFTRRVALLGAVVVAMTGCASVSEPSPLPSAAEASADQPLQPIDAPSPKSEALPPLPDPMALSPAAEQAVPKVERGNALAFEQAVAALRANRLREAEVLLLQITADQPELAGPWVNLGQVYVLLEQPDEARRAFTQAVAANTRIRPNLNTQRLLCFQALIASVIVADFCLPSRLLSAYNPVARMGPIKTKPDTAPGSRYQ